MKSVLNERDGYFENVTIELDASEALVFTRALVKFAEDDSEHSIDRLVATRMVRDLQKIVDTPQTDCDKCIWSVCNYNKVDWDADTPQTDCPYDEDDKCFGCGDDTKCVVFDAPQTEDYDFRDEQEYNDRWGTDCGWK